MTTRKWQALTVLALAGAALSSTSCLAFGRAPSGAGTDGGKVVVVDEPEGGETPAPEPEPLPPETVPPETDEPEAPPAVGDLDPDSLADGYALGERNGSILVDRLKLATVGRAGCKAVPQLQDALLKVSQTLTLPEGENAALSVGFIQGYLDTLKKGVHDARADCGVLAQDDGGVFAGALIGNLVCSVTEIGLQWVQALELSPLYEGWSGGLDPVVAGCKTSLSLTLEQCVGQASAVSNLELILNQSCAH